jgi:hypothetical protein
MNRSDPHHFRKEMILKEFPQVKELYGPEIKTIYYCIAVFSAQMGLAYVCSQSGVMKYGLRDACLGNGTPVLRRLLLPIRTCLTN